MAIDNSPSRRRTRPPRSRSERFFLRLLFGGLLVLVVLCVAGAIAYHFVASWQANRLARRAEAYLSWNDSKSAALVAREAINLDPKNVEACRALAKTAERDNQVAALDWRRKVVRLQPDSTDDVIALAKTALQFGEIKIAEDALTSLRGKANSLADYHAALAQLAVTKKDPKLAEAEYSQAVSLEPDSKIYQLNLAIFQLQSPDASVRLKASQLLQTFLADEPVRLAAARALFDYAIQRKDPAVIEIAELMRKFPEASLRDRMKCVQLLQTIDHPDYPSALTDLENAAENNPSAVADVISWMNTTGHPLLAIDWSKRMPSDFVMKRPVFIAVADSYIALKDWPGLQQHCARKDWRDLEFLRHAYLARSLREQGKKLDGDLEWSRAAQTAADPEAIYSLEQTVEKWGWENEAVDLLWRLDRDPKRQLAALTALYQYYSRVSDTGNLQRVASRLVEIGAADPLMQNNFAQLSLLLNQESQKARDLARKLQEEHPSNSSFASTYAYALYTAGRKQEALKVMERLPAEQLQQPAIAAYYGIILAANGNKEEARKYLDLGSTAHLLPEEKSLVEKSLAGIR